MTHELHPGSSSQVGTWKNLAETQGCDSSEKMNWFWKITRPTFYSLPAYLLSVTKERNGGDCKRRTSRTNPCYLHLLLESLVHLTTGHIAQFYSEWMTDKMTPVLLFFLKETTYQVGVGKWVKLQQIPMVWHLGPVFGSDKRFWFAVYKVHEQKAQGHWWHNTVHTVTDGLHIQWQRECGWRWLLCREPTCKKSVSSLEM